MRVAPDTNVVVSGLLWQGPPRQILDAARAGRITLFTTPVLLAELHDALTRPKLARRLAQAGVGAATLVVGFAALAVLVRPANIPPVVLADPDDDAVLACAVAAQGQAIVSGDPQMGRVRRRNLRPKNRLLASVFSSPQYRKPLSHADDGIRVAEKME